MGKFSRDKGQRTERNIVHAMQERGFSAERIPLSGSAGGSFAGDVTMPLLGQDRIFEVKCRADGFKFLYDSLKDHYGLIVKADNKTPLVVMPMDSFLSVAEIAETRKTLESAEG